MVLEGTLAALVADRAVQRVVDEQEFQHPVLGLTGPLGFGVNDHPGCTLEHARGLQSGAPACVDLNEAHSAHANRLHPTVVAEPRDVGTGALASLDQQFTRVGGHRLAVYLYLDDRVLHCVRAHEPASPAGTATATGMPSPRVIRASNS